MRLVRLLGGSGRARRAPALGAGGVPPPRLRGRRRADPRGVGVRAERQPRERRAPRRRARSAWQITVHTTTRAAGAAEDVVRARCSRRACSNEPDEASNEAEMRAEIVAHRGPPSRLAAAVAVGVALVRGRRGRRWSSRPRTSGEAVGRGGGPRGRAPRRHGAPAAADDLGLVVVPDPVAHAGGVASDDFAERSGIRRVPREAPPALRPSRQGGGGRAGDPESADARPSRAAGAAERTLVGQDPLGRPIFAAAGRAGLGLTGRRGSSCARPSQRPSSWCDDPGRSCAPGRGRRRRPRARRGDRDDGPSIARSRGPCRFTFASPAGALGASAADGEGGRLDVHALGVARGRLGLEAVAHPQPPWHHTDRPTRMRTYVRTIRGGASRRSRGAASVVGRRAGRRDHDVAAHLNAATCRFCC